MVVLQTSTIDRVLVINHCYLHNWWFIMKMYMRNKLLWLEKIRHLITTNKIQIFFLQCFLFLICSRWFTLRYNCKELTFNIKIVKKYYAKLLHASCLPVSAKDVNLCSLTAYQHWHPVSFQLNFVKEHFPRQEMPLSLYLH